MGARVNDSLGSNLPPHLLPYHLFLFMRSPHTVIHLMDYNRRISHECLETVLFFLSPLLSKKSPGYSLLLFLNNAFETLVIAGFQPILGIFVVTCCLDVFRTDTTRERKCTITMCDSNHLSRQYKEDAPDHNRDALIVRLNVSCAVWKNNIEPPGKHNAQAA